jgi:hypothetical protein
MTRILSLTAVGVVATGLMLAAPAKSEAAVPVGVSIGVGPVVGSFSTYPATPYPVYAPAPAVVVPPVYPAPVVVRPGYPCYRGYGYYGGYRGYGHYGHYGHHHYHGGHR